MSDPLRVNGDILQLAFPVSLEGLKDGGAAFLTEALHRAETLEPDNSVSRVSGIAEFHGGGAARKAIVSVEYERPAGQLHNDLFVKYPLDLEDPLQDWFGPLMEAEARFALLSRRPDFPIDVPKCYYADYSYDLKAGILVTETIAYGSNGIEPAYDKCRDYLLPEPLNHYRALATTLAHLPGAHRSGQFGNEIEREFPFDATRIEESDLIPCDAEGLGLKLSKLEGFAKRYPHLLPDAISQRSFTEGFVRDAPEVLAKEQSIKRYLKSQTDAIGLCHFNCNVDNAWFWRDKAGTLRAGLLDWGNVSQINLGRAFYGLLCAAEPEFIDAHRNELAALFLREYEKAGGPSLDVDDLLYWYRLSVAILGVAWMLDGPFIMEDHVPELDAVTDRFDPRINDVFQGRVQLHMLTVFLSEWRALDIGHLVRDWR